MKFLIALALSAVLLIPAFAVANGNGNDNDQGQSQGQSQGQGQNQGQGQSQGQSQGQGQSSYQGQGQGQSQSSKNKNTNKNTNKNSQSQSATGVGVGVGTGVGIGVGGSQSQSNSAVGSGNTTTVDASSDVAAPAIAPTVVAPSLAVAPETCMGSISMGGSGATPLFGLGLSFGNTWKSHDCELRMFAKSLQALGMNTAAIALLAQNADVKKALQEAGYDGPGVKTATLQVTTPLGASVAAVAPAPVDGGTTVEPVDTRTNFGRRSIQR